MARPGIFQQDIDQSAILKANEAPNSNLADDATEPETKGEMRDRVRREQLSNIIKEEIREGKITIPTTSTGEFECLFFS